MPTRFDFHPEALLDYSEAAKYYLSEASLPIADQFISAVESAVAEISASPGRYRVIEEPDVRRCVLPRFPYLIYYRWEQVHARVVIYAVMHSSREPRYWRDRIKD